MSIALAMGQSSPKKIVFPCLDANLRNLACSTVLFLVVVVLMLELFGGRHRNEHLSLREQLPSNQPIPPSQKASIIVIVTSKAGSTERRTWLRAQFKKNVQLLRQKDPTAADAVVLKFALGKVGLSGQDFNLTTAEQELHGDILMLDIIDNNEVRTLAGVETATALKVIHSAAWAVQNYDFPWLVRLGDDAFFRVDHFLLNIAPTLSKEKLMFGLAGKFGFCFSFGVCINYYCSGMGFIMTHDVAKYITDNAPHLYKGYPEDAVVGLWLAATNFKVQNDVRFHEWAWKSCTNDSILVHKHDYGNVDGDGIMRSCFPRPKG